MTRLTSIERAGYYPFPAEHLPALASYFAPAPIRLLDPVAGEGEAVAALGTAWGAEVFANELDQTRAAACRVRFGPTHAVQGDLYRLRASHGAFGALWLNPPYSWERTGADTRKEVAMIKASWKWAQVDGYALVCVYAHHVTQAMAWFLCRNADAIDIYRVPGLHLDTYVHVVLVAHVTTSAANIEARAEALVNAAQDSATLPLLTMQESPRYRFPPRKEVKRFLFSPDEVTADIALAALDEDGGAHTLPAFVERFSPPPPSRDVRPIIQPRAGQLAMLLAADLFNQAVLSIGGKKVAVHSTVDMVDDLVKVIEAKDKNASDTGIFQTRPQVTVTLLDETGHVDSLVGDDALIAFIKEHRQALLDYIDAHFKPVYAFDLGELARPLAAIRVKGKPLYPVQRHVVAALYATLQGRKGAILVGEPGVGKTALASSLAALMQPTMKPGQGTLVMAPPHLLDKWREEVLSVAPGAHVQILKHIEDVAAFFKQVDTLPDDTLKVGILSREGAKLNEKWRMAAYQPFDAHRLHTRLEALRRYRWELVPEPDFVDAPTLDRLAHSTLKRVPLPSAFVWRTVRQVEDGYEDAPLPIQLTHSRSLRKRVRLDLDALERKAHSFIYSALRCPTCGAPVYDANAADIRQKVAAERKRAADGHGPQEVKISLGCLTRSDLERAQRFCWQCGHALWQEDRWFSKAPDNPRIALADLFAKRYRGRIGLVIFDELHQLRSRESGQGLAMMRLANAADRVLGLTGTLFNGVASSLYGIEHTLNPAVRGLYPWGKRGEKGAYQGQARWVRTMGRLEKVIELRGDPTEATGTATGASKGITRSIREIPGCTPYLVREIIDHTLFVSIADLGAVMPPFVQRAVAVDMDSDMAEQYSTAYTKLHTYLLACRRDKDNTFMGTYRQALLGYPNAAFRDLPVLHHGEEVHLLPALGERLYPKEQTLVDLVRDELARQRRVVVFVRQTNTRDIQPRLAELLRQHLPGAQPYILPSSIAAGRRMSVVNAKTEAGINVLISNARLLETGVDLLKFQTAVFFELEDDPLVVAQASRRGWRIGQTDNCDVVYLYYRHPKAEIVTMEHAQVIRAARKERAAGLLYGEMSGGLSEADDDTSDSALIDLVQVFANDPTIRSSKDLFEEVNQRRNTASESAWRVEETAEPAVQPEKAPEPDKALQAASSEPDNPLPVVEVVAVNAETTPQPETEIIPQAAVTLGAEQALEPEKAARTPKLLPVDRRLPPGPRPVQLALF